MSVVIRQKIGRLLVYLLYKIYNDFADEKVKFEDLTEEEAESYISNLKQKDSEWNDDPKYLEGILNSPDPMRYLFKEGKKVISFEKIKLLKLIDVIYNKYQLRFDKDSSYDGILIYGLKGKIKNNKKNMKYENFIVSSLPIVLFHTYFAVIVSVSRLIPEKYVGSCVGHEKFTISNEVTHKKDEITHMSIASELGEVWGLQIRDIIKEWVTELSSDKK